MKRATSKRANEQHASACGKIILSGEYAVVFGKRGIALPSKEKIDVVWTPDPTKKSVVVIWDTEASEKWIAYVHRILDLIKGQRDPLNGTLMIKSSIPLGKGMGSSTALIIAVCRCLLGPHSAKTALVVEDALNPNHSGLDFTVIKEERPIVYEKGRVPKPIELKGILDGSTIIDTGMPNEKTRELVAMIRDEANTEQTQKAIEIIGDCTERILKGEPIKDVMRDHHKAQVMLGVVPPDVQKLIADIEAKGGAAKVIGAGGRTGGGGMVLTLK